MIENFRAGTKIVSARSHAPRVTGTALVALIGSEPLSNN